MHLAYTLQYKYSITCESMNKRKYLQDWRHVVVVVRIIAIDSGAAREPGEIPLTPPEKKKN